MKAGHAGFKPPSVTNGCHLGVFCVGRDMIDIHKLFICQSNTHGTEVFM